MRLHSFATVVENCQALIFVPIMQDMRQEVGVAAGGHRLEEISSLDGYTIHNAIGFQQLGRVTTTCGLSKSRPRGSGCRARITASILPGAPPTSTTVLNGEKSY